MNLPHDMHPPVNVPEPVAWVWWLIGIVVLGMVMGGLLWWLRIRRARELPRYEATLRELEALRARLETLEGGALATRLSQVLRGYAEGQLRMPALEMTEPQFLQAVACRFAGSRLDVEALSNFAMRCEHVKYSRAPLEPRERDALFTQARHCLENLHALITSDERI